MEVPGPKIGTYWYWYVHLLDFCIIFIQKKEPFSIILLTIILCTRIFHPQLLALPWESEPSSFSQFFEFYSLLHGKGLLKWPLSTHWPVHSCIAHSFWSLSSQLLIIWPPYWNCGLEARKACHHGSVIFTECCSLWISYHMLSPVLGFRRSSHQQPIRCP